MIYAYWKDHHFPSYVTIKEGIMQLWNNISFLVLIEQFYLWHKNMIKTRLLLFDIFMYDVPSLHKVEETLKCIFIKFTKNPNLQNEIDI